MILTVLFFTFFMSLLSYKFVENPFRFRKNPSSLNFALFITTYVCMGSIVFYYSIAVRHTTVSFIPFLSASSSVNFDWDKNACHNRIFDCKLKQGMDFKRSSVLIYGDSHAGQYSKFIDYMGKKEFWTADLVSADACRFSLSVSNNKNLSHRCYKVKKFVMKNLYKYDAVVFSNYWKQAIDSDKDFFKKLESDIKYLNNLNKSVFIFKDNPAIDKKNPLKIYIQHELGVYINNYENFNLENDDTNKKIKAIVDKYDNATWVDIPQFIPPSFLIDEKPVYKDSNHLNPYGALKLAEIYFSSGLKLID